jgi:hypothetical protein
MIFPWRFVTGLGPFAQKILSSSDQVLLLSTRQRRCRCTTIASHACTPISFVCPLFIPSRLRCLSSTDTDLLLTFSLRLLIPPPSLTYMPGH